MTMRVRILALAPLMMAAAAGAQPCAGSWLRPFGEGVAGGTNPAVFASVVFDDDGDGPRPPALYVAGSFTFAGSQPAVNVARWDGMSWSAVGAGTYPSGDHVPTCMAVFDDDGPGPHRAALYVGFGLGSNYDVMVARWDGASWQALPQVPSPIPNQPTYAVDSMAVFDADGPGPGVPRLYVTSPMAAIPYFQSGVLASWDGTSWALVGQRAANSVGMAVLDGPQSRGLYIAEFSRPYRATACGVAVWDGSTLRSVADAFSTNPQDVTGITGIAALDDDGPGAHPLRLFVSGRFTGQLTGFTPGAVSAFDGQTWTAADAGLPTGSVGGGMAIWEPGLGGPSIPTLVMASQNGLLQWDGAAWHTAAIGAAGPVYRLASLDTDGPGPLPSRLFQFGAFTVAGNRSAHGIAYWDGATWRAVGNSLDNAVHALLPVDGPTPPRGLYAAGAFATADGSAVGIARWDGAVWSGLGAGADNHVDALLLADIGGSTRLVAAGKFSQISGVYAGHIAQWIGSAWQPVGGGINGDVRALAPFTEGTGNIMVAGGTFSRAGQHTVSNIARYNGSDWATLGQGVDGPVDALASYNDGSGMKLFAAGEFTHAGGQAAAHIAAWNGSGWSPVGAGIDEPVYALAVFDDGSGPALYATGDFAHAGGMAAAGIARWNGQVWSALGSGLAGIGRMLRVFDLDGPGPVRPALYVGGDFTAAGGQAAGNLARWDGAWTAVSPGTDYSVLALAPFDPDGAGPQPPALFVGGAFANAGGAPAPILAAISGCSVCYANCDSSSTPPVLNISDFICFLNRFAAGDPYANCDGSTAPPVLNVNDFVCFQGRYAAGCP